MSNTVDIVATFTLDEHGKASEVQTYERVILTVYQSCISAVVDAAPHPAESAFHGGADVTVSDRVARDRVAALAERARIVAWLRSGNSPASQKGAGDYVDVCIADAIERGEHETPASTCAKCGVTYRFDSICGCHR